MTEADAAKHPTPGESTPTLPYRFASHHRVFLVRDSDDYCLYTAGRPSLVLLSEVDRWLRGQPYRWERLEETDFQERLTEYYQRVGETASHLAQGMETDQGLDDIADLLPEVSDLASDQDDAPVIRLLNALIAQAIRERASDIHLEVFEDHVSVRFRVDGVLHEVLREQRSLASLLVSRLKVMAGLDIAERRLPQDGRISVRVAGHPVDVRLSTLPSTFGERAVMRLLDKSEGVLRLSEMRMPEAARHIYEQALRQSHGIVLVTGPTGSGKTTTLYAGLGFINQPSRNIMTIEDPVEYMLPGIAQTQVNGKVGMTFARGLRALLRQDPDVVMVGEIRDAETARIAVQASLTGHLVLSTLHTNTAIGAITRLQDMGIEPFLLSSSLSAVFAQRLVRLLCPECREAYSPDVEARRRLGLADSSDDITLYHAKGCTQCGGKGYRGRTGIFEAIAVDDILQGMIHTGAAEREMAAYAQSRSPDMMADGRALVLNGATSLDELLRVVSD